MYFWGIGMSTFYEVIELSNGEIALQKEGDSRSKPLVTMRFSSELMQFLQDAKIDIAKVMIQAGLEHVAELANEYSESELLDSAAKKATNNSEDFNSEGVVTLDIDSHEDDDMGPMISHLLH